MWALFASRTPRAAAVAAAGGAGTAASAAAAPPHRLHAATSLFAAQLHASTSVRAGAGADEPSPPGAPAGTSASSSSFQQLRQRQRSRPHTQQRAWRSQPQPAAPSSHDFNARAAGAQVLQAEEGVNIAVDDFAAPGDSFYTGPPAVDDPSVQWPNLRQLARADEQFGRKREQQADNGSGSGGYSSGSNGWSRAQRARESERFNETAAADTPGGGSQFAGASKVESRAALIGQLERELALVEQTALPGGAPSAQALQLRRLAAASKRVLALLSAQSTQLEALQSELNQSEDTVRVLTRRITPQQLRRDLHAAGVAPRLSEEERMRTAAASAAMERALSVLTEPVRGRVVSAIGAFAASRGAASSSPSSSLPHATATVAVAPWDLSVPFLRGLILAGGRECTPQQCEQIVAFIVQVQQQTAPIIPYSASALDDEQTDSFSFSYSSAGSLAHAAAGASTAAAPSPSPYYAPTSASASAVLTLEVVEQLFTQLGWQQQSKQISRSYFQQSLVLLFQSLRVALPELRPSVYLYDLLTHTSLRTVQYKQELEVATRYAEHMSRRLVASLSSSSTSSARSPRAVASHLSLPGLSSAEPRSSCSPPFLEHVVWQWHDSAYTAPISPAQALQVFEFASPFLSVEHAMILWRHALEVRIVSQQLAQAVATLLAKQLAKLIEQRAATLTHATTTNNNSKDASVSSSRSSPLDDVVDECAGALVAVLSDWAVLERDEEELGLLCTNSSSTHVQRWKDPSGRVHWMDARSMRVMQCVHECDTTPPLSSTSAPPTPALDSFVPSGPAWDGWRLLPKNHAKAADPHDSLVWLLRSQLFASDVGVWVDVDGAGLSLSAPSLHAQPNEPHPISVLRSEHKMRVARHVQQRFRTQHPQGRDRNPPLSQAARAVRMQQQEFQRFLDIKDDMK